jgi:hypothetical protein
LVVVSKEEEIAQFEEGDTNKTLARSDWLAPRPTAKHLCLNLPQVRAALMLLIASREGLVQLLKSKSHSHAPQD